MYKYMNKYKDIVCSTQWRSKKWSITNKHPSAFISKSVVFHSIEFSFLTNSEWSLWWSLSSTLLYFHKYEFWKCKDIPNTRRYGQTEVFFGSAITRVYFVVENFLQIYSFLAVHCTPNPLIGADTAKILVFGFQIKEEKN